VIGVHNVSNSLNALITVVDTCLQSELLLRRSCDGRRAMSGAGKTRDPVDLTDKSIKALRPDPNGAYRVPDQRTRGISVTASVAPERSNACPWAAMAILAPNWRRRVLEPANSPAQLARKSILSPTKLRRVRLRPGR
jgi:hypothetical protein